jgi:hypothetical protein
VLNVGVFGADHVQVGEVELWSSYLIVVYSLVLEFHVWKDWARNTHQELGHLEDLFSRAAWFEERFVVNLLRDVIEVSEDYASLREGENSVERSLRLNYFYEVVADVFQAVDNVG